jgi:hypothetical protein
MRNIRKRPTPLSASNNDICVELSNAQPPDSGGLALDVPAGHLSLELVNKYLEVKERGLL